MAFYLISILTSYLASFLAFYLAFYLTFYSGILSGIYSDISILAFYLASILTYPFWHIYSGAEIWRSWLRSSSAHWAAVEFAVEVWKEGREEGRKGRKEGKEGSKDEEEVTLEKKGKHQVITRAKKTWRFPTPRKDQLVPGLFFFPTCQVRVSRFS